MRFFLTILLIAFISGALQIFLPWWVCGAASFILAITIQQNTSSAFWSGFFAIFLLWGGYAFWLDYSTQSFLTTKMIKFFSIPSPILMVLLTAFVGGLTGGFSSLSGNYLRQLFTK
jgi:hypothetical protein